MLVMVKKIDTIAFCCFEGSDDFFDGVSVGLVVVRNLNEESCGDFYVFAEQDMLNVGELFFFYYHLKASFVKNNVSLLYYIFLKKSMVLIRMISFGLS